MHLTPFRKNNRGNAGLEFALVLPLMLLVLFAIIEYGWCLTNWIVLNNAVAEGARAGIKARDWETDDAYAEDPVAFAVEATVESSWLSPLKEADISAEVLSADGFKPKRIRVTVSAHPYKPITGYLLKSMIPGHLGAKAVMAFP